ncbi:PREDICTED: C-type lectin 37Da-like [Drosophila arizonae]|uniref:C-type lectin 37Da-like n=1 Tax=Drosophila arizonae TaxID=7263 RepID=A0ABM1PI69_DROAR|nr:PREDICTED: C-type lectin 37Da-like [Drosophila arizonae]
MLWHQLIIFAIVALAFTQLHVANSQTTGVNTCPKNFTLVGERCLLAVGNVFNWYEADRNCRTKSAGVLSLISDKELQLVTDWLNKTMQFTLELWTSGSKLGSSSVYYWQSTGEPARYLPWATGQPKPTSGDCLMLSGTRNPTSVSNYRLVVRNCAEWAVSVCEVVPAKNTTTRICLKPNAYETVQVIGN